MFTEDYFTENLLCIEEACDRLGIPHQRFGKHNCILEVEIHPGQRIKFFRNKTPFNDNVTNILCGDKALQAEYFDRFDIPQPKTISVFNPHANERFDRYKKHSTVAEIMAAAEDEFDYPIIVKKNRSSLAKGVHLAGSRHNLESTLIKYFWRSNVVVFQEYIMGTEFRVVSYRGKALHAYEKVESESLDDRIEKSDLNPLHGGEARKVLDPALMAKFEVITQKIYHDMGITFAGTDIMMDDEGNLRVIETNGNPACAFYNEQHGREDFTQIYMTALSDLRSVASQGVQAPQTEHQNLNKRSQHHHRLLISQSDLESSSQAPLQ